MDTSEIIMIAGGVLFSMVTWFAKREITRMDTRIHELREQIRDLELDSQTNDTRDAERWHWIDKTMEDRRNDIRKLFDMVQDIYKQSCEWRNKR